MSHYQNFTPPFEIPDSWEWVRLDDIAQSNIGLTYKPTDVSKDGIPVYRSNNIQNRSICKDDIVRVDSEILLNQFLHEGDLLICARNGSRRLVGKNAIIQKLDEPTSFGAFMAVCRSAYNSWIHVLLNTRYFDRYLDASNSTAINQVTQKMLLDFTIPFPPIREQNRIISILSMWFKILDDMDKKSEDLKTTISNTKSKILELAMQGKLMLQDPEDEPAADMLRRINPKARIITDNPHSKNIPEGWCETMVSDLCVFLSRGKSPKYSENPNQYPVFAQKCNLKEGGISLDQARFLDETTLDKWPDKYHLLTGDVLINSTGTGTVGRTRFFDECYLGTYPYTVPDSHVSVVRSFNEINSKFLFYYLYSPAIQEYFEDNLAGSTNQKELYIDVIGSARILLPPVLEQERIVTKIETLYLILDKIEASLQS